MAVNKRKRSTTDNDLGAKADAVAKKLAGRAYGEEKDKMVNTSITLPKSILVRLEDMALKNKRKGKGAKSVSALIREGLESIL